MTPNNSLHGSAVACLHRDSLREIAPPELNRYVALRPMRTKEEIEDETRSLKAEYGVLFDGVEEILFRHDPIGINFEDNTDEYEPEVRTILPRLRFCQSPEDVMTVVHEEFQRWFDPDLAGPPDKYANIANEVWTLWSNSLIADAT